MRRDVEHPAALEPLLRDGLARQPVERPQERRQRLARAGGGHDEGVVAGADGLPGSRLRLRGLAEGPPEPRRGGGGEALEHVGGHCENRATAHRHRRGRRDFGCLASIGALVSPTVESSIPDLSIRSPRPGHAVTARRPAAAWRVVIPAAVAQAVVLTIGSGGYGYHRDELYFRMLPPAWGYVDQPPLVPFLARTLAGVADQAWALRLPATLASALSVVLVALVCRELGGGRGAQALAAWGCALSTMPLMLGHLLLTSTLDQVFWLAVVLAVLRAVSGRVHWWAVAGAGGRPGVLQPPARRSPGCSARRRPAGAGAAQHPARPLAVGGRGPRGSGRRAQPHLPGHPWLAAAGDGSGAVGEQRR